MKTTLSHFYHSKKIAIFFDCENISSKYVDEIFDELAKIGEITINKAYHNWNNEQSKEWRKKLSQFNIEKIQVTPNISGKNSVDIKMTIDVTNATHQKEVDIIVLVSSDSDFSALAIDIKAKAIKSIGFGEDKTPTSLRKEFTLFIELAKKNKLTILKESVNNTKGDYGFSYVSDVATYLKSKYASLTPQNFGEQRWTDILKKENEHFVFAYKHERRTLLVKTK